MWVGTFSGVTSPGMVISSALGGTNGGNSSPTKARMIEVFPHWAVMYAVEGQVLITHTIIQ